MSLQVHACGRCGAHHFPARLRCPRCGGTALEPVAIHEATVSGVTHAHRRPEGCRFHCLVELRTAGGATLLAAADHAPALGSLVGLCRQADGAIVVSPL